MARLKTYLSSALIVGALAAGAQTFAPLDAAALPEPRVELAGSLPLPALWQAYKLRFVRADGRVVDTANGNISHSEGQGYAMVLAVAARDMTTFARIWSFARTKLQVRKDALFSWKIDTAAKVPVADKNNASDGDLLIAWALLEADAAGFPGDHRAQAQRILADLWKLRRSHAVHGDYLLPGAVGFENRKGDHADVVNTSYAVFPAFTRIAELTGDTGWLKLAQGGRNMIAAASLNKAGLPSDWSRLPRDGISLTPAKGWKPTFSYNAIRVPLYSAWAGLAPPLGWTGAAPKETNVDSGKPAAAFRGAGYRAIAALTECAASGTRFPNDLRKTLDSHYYPASLHLLSAVAIKQRYPQCW